MRDIAREASAGKEIIAQRQKRSRIGIRYHSERPPEPRAYAALVRDAFGALELDLAFEPGRVLVGPAGLLVARDVDWPVTNLRVDWSDSPIADLRALWTRWAPQRDDYVRRALAPDEAPGYGVPGDDR